MAARWQQWMPFHIDRFIGSPWVQAMHPSAQTGYLRLLAAQWQTEDSTLPDDDGALAILSGLAQWKLWDEFKVMILRHFPTCEDGKRRNGVCFKEWSEAKRVFDARRDGGNGKRRRSDDAVHKDSKNSPHGEHGVSTSRAHTQTQTTTGTGTEKQKAIPSKPSAVEEIYQAYPRKVGRDAALKAISRALDRARFDRKRPHEAEAYLLQQTRSYARSPAGNDGEFTPHPATWFNQGRYADDEREWQRKSKSPPPALFDPCTPKDSPPAITPDTIAQWRKDQRDGKQLPGHIAMALKRLDEGKEAEQ